MSCRALREACHGALFHCAPLHFAPLRDAINLRFSVTLVVFLFALTLTCSGIPFQIPFQAYVQAQHKQEPDRDVEPDHEPEFRPGLLLKLKNSRDEFASTAVDRIDSERVIEGLGGQSPDHWIWTGFIRPPREGVYTFHISSDDRGATVELHIGDQLMARLPAPGDGSNVTVSSGPIPLEFERYPFRLEYRSQNRCRLVLSWSSAGMPAEVVGSRHFFRDGQQSGSTALGRGRDLAVALQCDSCHAPAKPSGSAPSLQKLSGNLRGSWLVDWLMATPDADCPPNEVATSPVLRRRMPHFAQLSREDAIAIGSYLLTSLEPPAAQASSKPGDPAAGKNTFLSVGCLACHTWQGVGQTGLWDGGDLTFAASKRPSTFFDPWLQDPASLNSRHRMPVFDLMEQERLDLAAFLREQSSEVATQVAFDESTRSLGKELVHKYRCQACHVVPDVVELPNLEVLSTDSHWSRACSIAGSHSRFQPAYDLIESDRDALRAFYSWREPLGEIHRSRPTTDYLRQQNCTNCHARDSATGLGPTLLAMVEKFTDFRPGISAMTPPSLDGIGAKLTDGSLRDAIRRNGPVRRPYLNVRMPKYVLDEQDWHVLERRLISADRAPESISPDFIERMAALENNSKRYAGASRLVTTEGFGCTSCHQVGSQLPAKAPVNARGPDLSQLGKRIRREWFERLVREPLRVVPGVEMPSLRIPVRGIMNDDLELQIAAVWGALNTPGFEPPTAEPVRVVNRSGVEEDRESATLITDIIRDKETTFTHALLVGLPNRNNILFDLESATLRRWSLGDSGWQRTQGKSWFWEMPGRHLLDADSEQGPQLIADGWSAEPIGQWRASLEEWQHDGPSLIAVWHQQFRDSNQQRRRLRVRSRWSPLEGADWDRGFSWEIELHCDDPRCGGLPVQLQLASPKAIQSVEAQGNGQLVQVVADGVGNDPMTISLSPCEAEQIHDGKVRFRYTNNTSRLRLEFRSLTRADRYPTKTANDVLPLAVSSKLEVAPGVQAERWSLPGHELPTALAWDSRGSLLVASLTGRILRLIDADGDGRTDTLETVSDDLAGPYGLSAWKQGDGEVIDVCTKFGLIRLEDVDGNVSVDRSRVVASGWGYSPDYHDWAVGLPRDESGNYYMAFPCQQDERHADAARLRGTIVRLSPRQPTPDDFRLFDLEPISRGHRFPMGIARSETGEIFVTDNQGNYNPFNELNHVRPGRHFGFINAMDAKQPAPQIVTPAAIEIPHPWTRSVNGICFLLSPPHSDLHFGGWEGQMIGCEYDTRRLIRLSLQQVGDQFQGAAYPLTPDEPTTDQALLGSTLLGPICAAVSPKGELWIGSLRDSGWGAGNNIGEVVRISLDVNTLPCGISEVRATATGFDIEFTRQVHPEIATRSDSYQISSYQRISTPAYGGPDRDRREETVREVTLDADRRRVRLRLGKEQLRAGFVYDIHVRNLAGPNEVFHPADAYYTLRAIPAE